MYHLFPGSYCSMFVLITLLWNLLNRMYPLLLLDCGYWNWICNTASPDVISLTSVWFIACHEFDFWLNTKVSQLITGPCDLTENIETKLQQLRLRGKQGHRWCVSAALSISLSSLTQSPTPHPVLPRYSSLDSLQLVLLYGLIPIRVFSCFAAGHLLSWVCSH